MHCIVWIGYQRPRRPNSLTPIFHVITPHYILNKSFHSTPLHRKKVKQLPMNILRKANVTFLSLKKVIVFAIYIRLFHCSNACHILEPRAKGHTALNLGSAKPTAINKSQPTNKRYKTTQTFKTALDLTACTL